MKILGIESSCDDTSVALLEATDDGFVVLSEKTADQIDVHKKYGGVVPEIAGRMHAEKIMPLVEEVMKQDTRYKKQDTNKLPITNYQLPKPDVIAVTAGPGLMTGLMVGVEAAKALSYLWEVPVVRVNHIEGHIYSVLLKDTKDKIQDTNKSEIQNSKSQKNIRKSGLSVISKELQFPCLCLIVSGGHTELILMKKHGKYELIGKTRDDAAGEAFDKVAKLLGLEYPGGPKISKLAQDGDPTAIPFPRPMIDDETFDFSFSGLKTAALYWLRDHSVIPSGARDLSKHRMYGSRTAISKSQATASKDSSSRTPRNDIMNDFCASFEQAIVDVLVTKTIRAAKQFKPKTVILAGGVSANKKLRDTLQSAVSNQQSAMNLRVPPLRYTMDNGTMIATAGYFHAIKKDFTPWQKLEADPNWKIY